MRKVASKASKAAEKTSRPISGLSFKVTAVDYCSLEGDRQADGTTRQYDALVLILEGIDLVLPVSDLWQRPSFFIKTPAGEAVRQQEELTTSQKEMHDIFFRAGGGFEGLCALREFFRSHGLATIETRGPQGRGYLRFYNDRWYVTATAVKYQAIATALHEVGFGPYIREWFGDQISTIEATETAAAQAAAQAAAPQGSTNG